MSRPERPEPQRQCNRGRDGVFRHRLRARKRGRPQRPGGRVQRPGATAAGRAGASHRPARGGGGGHRGRTRSDRKAFSEPA
eukprot:3217174-Pyramimonas_sp.AAC.1